MTTYYTYKNQVQLGPNQILGYTPGKGYYAKSETPPSSSSSGIAVEFERLEATARAPVAVTPELAALEAPGADVGIPTTPAGAKHPTTNAVSKKADAPTSDGGYYNDPFDLVLKPGQTIAYKSGKGYYVVGSATGTTSASSTPSSTVTPNKSSAARIPARADLASPPSNFTRVLLSPKKASAIETVTRGTAVAAPRRASTTPILITEAVRGTRAYTTVREGRPGFRAPVSSQS